MPGPITFPQPVLLGVRPPDREGSKAVFYRIFWNDLANAQNTFVAKLNLLAQFQTGQFTTIQSVFVDNSTVPEMVTVTCDETGFSFTVPPFAKGMYPICSASTPSFTLTLNESADPVYGMAYTTCTTKFAFFNTPQPYFESLPSSFGQNFNSYWTGLAFGPAGAGSQTVALTGQGGGPGLASLGNGKVYAFNSIDLVVISNAVFPAAGPTSVDLREQNASGPFVRWRTGFLASSTVAQQIVYTRQQTFPTPLMQIDPSNDFALAMSQVPAAGNVTVFFHTTYSVLTIA